MLQDGAQFEKLKMRYYSDNYRGCHAARAMKKGETILFVPLKEIITLEMCMTSPIGTLMYKQGFRNRLLSPKHSFFSCFLMEETRKPDSYWSKYIDILPKSFEVYPIFYTPEELTWLDNTDMVRMVNTKIEDMKRDYDTITTEVPEFSAFPFKEYMEKRLLVASRIFGISVEGHKTDGFVPYADMLNHKRPRETSWTYDDDRGGFIIDAIVDIERGQAIHDSYGRKSNTRFLLNYGFINLNNDANDLPITFMIRHEDPMFTQKIKMMG
jgi:histone-lysine N-methyltransferase SETD3